MLRTLAVIFGLALIGFGIIGFMPSITTDGMIYGIFKTNAAHNVVHMAIGVIAIWTGFTSSYAAKLFFAIFGIVWVIVAIVGFMHGDQNILGLIANNPANSWLHLAIGIVALFLGFGVKKSA